MRKNESPLFALGLPFRVEEQKHMLLVGRELYIQDQPVTCIECGWDGVGGELATGSLPALQIKAYVYAYRCAHCGSFEVRRKARVLTFRRPAKADESEAPPRLTRNRV